MTEAVEGISQSARGLHVVHTACQARAHAFIRWTHLLFEPSAAGVCSASCCYIDSGYRQCLRLWLRNLRRRRECTRRDAERIGHRCLDLVSLQLCEPEPKLGGKLEGACLGQ